SVVADGHNGCPARAELVVAILTVRIRGGGALQNLDPLRGDQQVGRRIPVGGEVIVTVQVVLLDERQGVGEVRAADASRRTRRWSAAGWEITVGAFEVVEAQSELLEVILARGACRGAADLLNRGQ